MLVRLFAAAVVLSAAVAPGVGCSGPSDSVAIARLAVDRLSVPLGGTVDLTIQFDVAPTLDPLEEDHRVFLHVFDDSETFLWASDHEPPVPTSEWRPGQSIQYTHRLEIPAYPYIGLAVIGIGLQSSDSGARLPLAGRDLGEFVYEVAALAFEPRHESSYVVYGEGWYPVEFQMFGQTAWRWTGERAVLSFRNPYRTARLVVDVQGRPAVFEQPQLLSFVVGERTIREVTLDTGGVVRLDYELTESDLGSGDVVDLELLVDRTFVPAELDDTAADTRRLGVRVLDVHIEPLSEPRP